MIRRVAELTLLLLLVIGAVGVWKTGRERAHLQAEYDRLVSSIGELPIGDPTKVHIRAIPTGEPLQFAWRVYTPAGYLMSYRSSAGMSGSGSAQTRSEEFMARIQVREVDGRLHVNHQWKGIGGRSSLGDATTAKLLRGREGRIVVEQFASGRVETFDPDEPIPLLRLIWPEDLETEGRKTLSASEKSERLPVLLEFDLGPKDPRPRNPSRPGR